MVEITIKRVKLRRIRLNPDNPRRIAQKNMDYLIKSIQDFPEMMQLREIVVDETMTVLGGNMRALALRKTGAKECTAKIVKGLTHDQKREFIVKDNGSFGEWDFDLLANGFDDLPLADFGVDLPEDWLAGDKTEVKEDDFDADAAAESITDPITKPGDVWLLDKHRVMCGDSTKKEDVGRLCGTQKADMVFTDPPYGIDVVKKENKKLGSIGGSVMAKTGKYKPVQSDESTDTAKAALNILFGICKNFIIWGGNYFTDFLNPSRGWIIWDKRNGDTTFADAELAWTSFDKSVRLYSFLWSGMRREGDREHEGKLRFHPTQKPVGLTVSILTDWADGMNVIVDTFLGSGTTLIACEQLGRICYGMEIDPVYCDVIVKRWETLTGKKAILEV